MQILADEDRRDMFAAMAFPHIVSYTLNADQSEMNKWAKDANAPKGTTTADLAAMAAYAYADAMMRRRNTPNIDERR